MKILVMLDPTNKRGTKKAYTDLRNFLVSDGYLRIGTDLYMRITPSRKSSRETSPSVVRALTGHRNCACSQTNRKAI